MLDEYSLMMDSEISGMDKSTLEHQGDAINKMVVQQGLNSIYIFIHCEEIK